MKALLNRLFDYGQLTREEARELLVRMSAGEHKQEIAERYFRFIRSI